MTWTQLNTPDWIQWTPTLTATGTNPSGFVASGTSNVYQKIGDLVIVRLSIGTSATTGNSAGTGRWRCSLPVQPKHSSGYSACGYYYLYNSNNDSGIVGIYGNIVLHSTSQSTSTVEFATFGSDGSGSTLQTLPLNLNYTSTVMSISARFFYEAL